MSDRIDDDHDLFDDPQARERWQRLGQMAMARPANALRHRVLNDLRAPNAPARPWWQRVFPAQSAQWVGVAAATLIGAAIGATVNRGDQTLDQRMAQLEAQLGEVNQQLLVSRLTATAPGERLAAALQAASMRQRDPAVAAALLQRAAIDAVPSVRSAAIGALGNEINETRTAGQLMSVLTASDSPIVQMAIIDLILRHGDPSLQSRLRDQASAGTIHPSLAGYVQDTLKGTET